MLMESDLYKENCEKTSGDNRELSKAGQTVGEGVSFNRIRRITGYLVGTLERFNNAKKAEEKDRVRHGSF